MSQTIAIAGAGGIGKHIVDAFVEQGKHKLIVLSRGTNQELADCSIEVRTVDYTSVSSLSEALKGVDVVISFIVEFGKDVSQENLLEAATANGVKRFIPSEWGIDSDKHHNDSPAMYDFKRVLREKLVKQDKIEYTLVANGLFMDYLLPKGSKKHLKDVPVPVNVEERKARIPGNGEDTATMTYADDIGKAVVKLIDDPRPWPKYTYINGATFTWHQLVKWGEEVTGDKFHVEYVPTEKLEKRIEDAKAAGDPMEIFFADIDARYASDFLRLPQNANPTLFQGIDFKQPKDLIAEWYGKRQ
ncbi:hypothetical protein INT43_005902 [Umbelopsis isabellina]|uniref:NmrA-like domain-containing protein n=1 Tax=Mortierella isabellina TaxID=91625 RepID=A0A8H7PJD8_MORIS|nr:hypothetical protein INT43_005902 [Umbelopsis isabellina]